MTTTTPDPLDAALAEMERKRPFKGNPACPSCVDRGCLCLDCSWSGWKPAIARDLAGEEGR
jgi:hypothetical protein